MCGIIGYTGSEDVREVLLDALELLEYRGYDSAGIALRDEESGKTEVRKCAGRVSDLRAICASEKVVSQCGIGHTRWATHGGVNDCMHTRIKWEKSRSYTTALLRITGN